MNAPMLVIHKTDVVMYQNGIGFLEALKQDRNTVVVGGMCGALSRDLNSDMAAVPCTAVRWMDEEVLAMLGEHPELAGLKGDLQALRGTGGSLKMGAFTYEQMKVFVKEYAENKKTK